MPDFNEEMRLTADYAISTAKERYGLVLDYSEESLDILDNILEKIYWGFSSHSKEEGEGGLVYNTATIWGSYLGEYMRLKWGGTWVMKGTQRCISITSIEFSPINFIFQRITSHPEYRVKNYVQETKNVIYTSVIHAKKPQFVPESAGQPVKAQPANLVQRLSKFDLKSVDKRLVYITGGILGMLVVILGCMVGYVLISSSGQPLLGLFADATSTSTISPSPFVQPSATAWLTDTATPTMTQLPTYTSAPTKTQRPSSTPYMTATLLASWTPTETKTATPTDTLIPRRSPTPTRTQGITPQPPSTTRTPTPTTQPSPTNTLTQPPPPPSIVSCGVSPSQVPVLSATGLTFQVTFSEPGYGFNVGSFNPSLEGQIGCTAPDTGGVTTSCTGVSGLVPSNTTVTVTLNSNIGSCDVKYSSTQ